MFSIMGSWAEGWSDVDSNQLWDEIFDVWNYVLVKKCLARGRERCVAAWADDNVSGFVGEGQNCAEWVPWVGSVTRWN